jgi:hypothetical protein
VSDGFLSAPCPGTYYDGPGEHCSCAEEDGTHCCYCEGPGNPYAREGITLPDEGGEA